MAVRADSFDIDETLLLAGNCNSWGEIPGDAQQPFLFERVRNESLAADEREQRLQVRVGSRRLAFQILSAARLWDWRVHPPTDGASSSSKGRLYRGVSRKAQLSRNRENKAAHGRNFTIREEQNAIVDVVVRLSNRDGIFVRYDLKIASSVSLPSPRIFDNGVPCASPKDVGLLRLVGSFCHWSTHAEGLNLAYQGDEELAGKRWFKHRVCIRMQANIVKFQIVGESYRFKWRIFPKAKKHRVLLRGDSNKLQILFGPGGHGKNFHVKEPFLTVITLTVWLAAVDECAPVSDVCVVSEVEGTDDGAQVAIGRRTYQYPPRPVSPLDRMIHAIAESRDKREEIVGRIRLLFKKFRSPIGLPVIPLGGVPGKKPARVAAMLMLRPSALMQCSVVFRTYLCYHMLAPEGPQFAHIFVFMDEVEDEEESDEEGRDDDEPPSGDILQWLDQLPAAEAAELKERVTVLDGSRHASLEAMLGIWPDQIDQDVRTAALAGELCAKQLLNAARCLTLASEHNIDWLLCNLDDDEAFFCSSPVGELLCSVPVEYCQVAFLNHEGVCELREPQANFFLGTTLFKRNPLLMRDPTDEQYRCIKVWGGRASMAAAQALDAEALPLNDARYFLGYTEGKTAVRVSSCREWRLFPASPHRWESPASTTGAYSVRADVEQACILHYYDCQGATGLAYKYSGDRAKEHWNTTEFHNLCQQLHRSGKLDSLPHWALSFEGDEAREELVKQLDAGVCLRIEHVCNEARLFS